MITNINSTPVQNKMALNNRPQKSNQNFGKIVFPKDTYTHLQKTAKEEFIKINKDLDEKIAATTEATVVEPIITPAINFLKNIQIFKNLIDNIKSNNGKLHGHEPTLKKDLGALANNYFFEKPDGEMGSHLEKLYDFFEVQHPEIDVAIHPEIFAKDYYKPMFYVKSNHNPYKIGLYANNIESITRDTNESLTNVKKTQDALIKTKDDFNTDYDAISNMEF